MKNSQYQLYVCLRFLLIFTSCGNHDSEPAPEVFFVVRTIYKSSTGEDLLKQGLPTSFKKADLKVVSKIDFNGTIKEMTYNFNENGIDVYFDGDTNYNYFDLAVPTNAGKNPIETLITLSPTDKDTVTYTYGPTIFKYVPDKIYYNKKLVWEEATIPRSGAGRFPPIIVIK